VSGSRRRIAAPDAKTSPSRFHSGVSSRVPRIYLLKAPLLIRSCKYSNGGFSIPQVTIKTGLKTPGLFGDGVDCTPKLRHAEFH
jgi:hypothetical protein